MGNVWLHDSPALIREAGLELELYPGWELRSRSSGGLEEVRGIGGHHDARRIGQTDQVAEWYMWEATGSGQPIGNFRVRQSGVIVLGTAGASNTQGKGGPLVNSKGQTIPLNDGNRWMIAIEAENDGLGEVWPQDQIDAYLGLVVVLCKQFDLDPGVDYWGHWGYCLPSCPGRKVDPSGPTEGYPSLGGLNDIWPDTEFRRLAKIVATPPPPPEPEPVPTPTPTPTGDDVLVYFVAKAPTNEGGSLRVTQDFATQVRFGTPDQISQWFARMNQIREDHGINVKIIDYATGRLVTSLTEVSLINDIWKMGATVSSMPATDPTP